MNQTGRLQHSFFLTIAGVRIEVTAQAWFADRYEPEYRPFLSGADAGAPPPAMRISVLWDTCVPNGAPVIFDTDSAWKMQPEGDGYRLSFYAVENGNVHTIARCDADTGKVELYLDQNLPPESRGSWQANPVRYPLDQLLLMNHLASRGGVVVHAAGVVVEGQALIFPGASGAGKSTLSQLFMAGGRTGDLLSDDRVIVRLAEDACEVWGTPWPGDAEIAANASAPLAAVFFLVKADVNQIVPLSASAALRRLLPVVSCPWYDSDRLPGVLDTCGRIVGGHPCFDLRFRAEGEVVDMLLSGAWR